MSTTSSRATSPTSSIGSTFQSHKVSGAYEDAEVQLILEDIFKRLPGGGGTEGTLQIMTLVQTCFMISLRAYSLVASNKQDENKLGLRHEDISFTTMAPGAWTLHLLIKNLKGLNTADNTMEDKVQMHPIKHPSPSW